MKPRLAMFALAASVSLVACVQKHAETSSPKAAKVPLPNVHTLGSLISGGVPAGDAAFDELKAMGVKTIISVDGATPDVARAEARGMRYVHIPITYSDVPEQQKLEIARAIRDLPGPVYIHCHHGKHRSPAATAAAAVTLGLVTPAEGVVFMRDAGTSPSYAGLFQCVEEAVVVPVSALNAASNEFPSVRKPTGVVAAMVEIDYAYEHLQEIRAAGWTVPKDHPDLVPAAEAGRLADQLRFSGEDPRSQAKGPEYAARLADAIARTSALEDGLIRGEPRDQLESKWKLVAASCKECHAAYRDRRN
ncbi:MAG: hypothetical protein KF678_03745 [Phycisphaeraceae bacterium]|nr:hypothetical protein [Phycisphaeraceae bacterium]